MASILRTGDTFVDVGSNMGAYSLWAALSVGPSGRVVAIEADEQNYEALVENVALNSFHDRITTVRCGVSDRREALPMHRNVTGNCGGHNFVGRGEQGPLVHCKPLEEVLEAVGVQRVRMMKLDIEGFERKVLSQYFNHLPVDAMPDYLLVEIEDSPAPPDEKEAVRRLVAAHDYVAVRTSGNSLFRRRSAIP